MQLNFSKYQGTGNDFIIIDAREQNIELTTNEIAFLCNRRFGIGADGLMMVKPNTSKDFTMVYYNADGNEGSMCGNGGRCMVQFVIDKGLQRNDYIFDAVDGLHEAKVGANGWIHLKMKDVTQIDKDGDAFVLNTGSPHYVKSIPDVQNYAVKENGMAIRYSDQYRTQGINVNFIEWNNNLLYVRTYERGVEDETFSCGTGVTAAAIVSKHHTVGIPHRISIQTKGGELAVEFEQTEACTFNNIWLCGPATQVFEGSITVKG